MNKMRGVARQTRRTYGHLTEAWDGYRDWLVSLIRTTSPKRILEVGGGANPALSLEEVAALGVSEYTVLDVSERELSKTPSGYVKICADICSDDLPVTSNYDFFGHGYYNRIPLVRRIHRGLTNMLLKRPVPLFTSCAYLVLQRPSEALTSG